MSSEAKGCPVVFCAGALAASGIMFLISVFLLGQLQVAERLRNEGNELESDLVALLDAYVKCRVDGGHPSHIRDLAPYLPPTQLNYSVDAYMLLPDAGPFDPIIATVLPELAERRPKGITVHGKFTDFVGLEYNVPSFLDFTQPSDTEERPH